MARRVITYRLPPEPSRHRVAVWRELRRLDAVTLAELDEVYQARERP